MTETPLGVDIDRLKAENDKLREALEKSKATMNIMANKAHEVGLRFPNLMQLVTKPLFVVLCHCPSF